MYFTCVNAEGQPRLTEGATYTLILDVKEAVSPKTGAIVSGYMVQLDGSLMAIPYVYSRKRFVAYTPPAEELDSEFGEGE